MKEIKFTYKTKKRILYILIILLSLLVYKKILKRVYNETSRYFTYSSKRVNQVGLNDSILVLNERVKRLEEVLGEENFDENFIQQKILQFLSKSCERNGVEVTNLEQSHVFKSDEYMLVTNFFTLKGNYNSLIKTIYKVENEFKKSKLNSVNFYKKRNHILKKEELYVELFFQNFKSL